ncbi:hypothetical protein JI435_405500, partial [Parastagonospora nodorum SN15]
YNTTSHQRPMCRYINPLTLKRFRHISFPFYGLWTFAFPGFPSLLVASASFLLHPFDCFISGGPLLSCPDLYPKYPGCFSTSLQYMASPSIFVGRWRSSRGESFHVPRIDERRGAAGWHCGASRYGDTTCRGRRIKK